VRGEGERGRDTDGERNRERVFPAEVKICFLKCPTASVENTANN
jgi:hypothetical protein